MQIYTEILHDRESGMQDTSDVIAGLQLIEEASGVDWVLIGDSRQISISRPGTDVVLRGKQRWPELPATYSIVMTNREIRHPDDQYYASGSGTDNPSRRVSRSISGFATLASDVALVSTHNRPSRSTLETTAHESGHLLLAGVKAGFEHHCGNPYCIMTAHEVVQYKHVKPPEHSFCDPCQGDFQKAGQMKLGYARLKMLRQSLK